MHSKAQDRTGQAQEGWLKKKKKKTERHWQLSTEHQWHQWSEMSARSQKATIRQHPTQPQSVRPAAVWQEIQKLLLLYNQTPWAHSKKNQTV